MQECVARMDESWTSCHSSLSPASSGPAGTRNEPCHSSMPVPAPSYVPALPLSRP